MAVGSEAVGQVRPWVLGDRDLQVQRRHWPGTRRRKRIDVPGRLAGLQPRLATAVRPTGDGDLVTIQVGISPGRQGGQPLRISDLEFPALEVDRPAGRTGRSSTWARRRNTGRRLGFVWPVRAVIEEPTGGVVEHV